MKLKTLGFLQLSGKAHRQAFPQPFRFIRMCFNRRGHFNRLSVRYFIFCSDFNSGKLVEIRAFSVPVFQNVLYIRCRRKNKSFLIQQFCKTAAPKNFSVACGSLFAVIVLKILQFFLDNRKKVCYTVRKPKIK